MRDKDGRPGALFLPVREDLDTAGPVSDRRPGVLQEAREGSGQYWGPRRGSQAFTRVGEGPGTASLYDALTCDGSSGAYAQGQSADYRFGELGTKFTLDIWFRLDEVAYAAGQNAIGIYSFYVGSSEKIDVSLRGPAHADHEKVRVEIVTSSTRLTSATRVAFTGATRISYGTAQSDRHHVRVVRDGATATLYLDGLSDGSTSSLSATNHIYGPQSGGGAVTLFDSIAYSDDLMTLYNPVPLKGRIFGAVLRDGAFTSQPIEAVMPTCPHAQNVHHYYLGRNFDLGGNDHIFDAGRYGAHARVLGSGWTMASANDNAAPAPSPVQGMRTWTTRTGVAATSVMAGGILSTAAVS